MFVKETDFDRRDISHQDFKTVRAVMVTKIHPNCIITEEVTQNHPKAEKLTLFELHSEMISFFGHVGKGIFFIGRLYKRTDGRPCFNLKFFECFLLSTKFLA